MVVEEHKMQSVQEIISSNRSGEEEGTLAEREEL